MHRTRTRSFALALFLIFALLLGAGCAKSSNTPANAGDQGQAGGEAAAPADATPQIAVYANSSDVMIFWDPSDSFSNEIIAMNNMYETLLRYNPAEDKMEPVLATDYSHSEDGKTWTFTIRKGVKFHGSGREMTAEDVKKSIERTISRGQGAAFIWDSVEKIEVKDAQTVVFHLKYPAPLDLVAASPYAAFIFDADYIEAQGGTDWLNQGHDAGTGPYTAESWQKGEDLVLTRFADYWRGWDGKHFDKVVMRGVEEPSTRKQMLDSGEADFTNMLPYDMLPAYENHPDLQVAVGPSYQNLLALINTERLSNPKVREALAWAFPYQTIIDTVAKGYATQAKGIVPVSMWGHGDNQRQQDLEKARALLAEAGVSNLKLLITYSSGDDAQRQIAELYAADLQKVGVTAETRGMPWEAQWDLAKSKDASQRQDIFLFYWWPDVATPDTWHRSMFHSEEEVNFNLGYYKNPAYDALIDEAVKLAGTDRNAAAAKYAEADKLLFDDAAAIPIYDISYAHVMKKNLKGYVDNWAYPNVVFWYDVYREQ